MKFVNLCPRALDDAASNLTVKYRHIAESGIRAPPKLKELLIRVARRTGGTSNH